MGKHETACVDLFCGAGGLTHGLISTGMNVVAGIDVDEACRYPFEANNGAIFVKKDIADVTPRELQKLFQGAEYRILAGCAPCQPFSTYAQRYDVVGSPRWSLLYQFARLVRNTRPELVTMENVPSLAKHAVYEDFVRTLRRLGYSVFTEVVDCAEFGLPQSRRRLVLLASLIGPIDLIRFKRRRSMTVREAIGSLPPITHGMAHMKDPLHCASKLSTLNLKRIRASRPGGTWRDWPKHLIADCHRRETGHSYPGVYGRMTWDDSAPTLTTQFYGFGSGRFGHPEQDRAISLREGAILQGFPKTYSFVPKGEPIHFKALGRMIGNAVPVTLGKVIGQSIATHLGRGSELTKKMKGSAVNVARKPLVA